MFGFYLQVQLSLDQGDYKIIEPVSVSLSETFCIDRIAVSQFIYLNDDEFASASNSVLEGYIAGIYGYIEYYKFYTYYWDVYGYHEFEDNDFDDLYETSYDSIIL